MTTAPPRPTGDPLGLAALLLGDAVELERCLAPVRRRTAGLTWSGPVREAFADSLAGALADLSQAAAGLRAEADRAVRAAVGCAPAPADAHGGSGPR